ncbi:hypothetical protein DNTS_022753 [Danionella cerebrum]|uniref:Uncharacterized protein n=1 Tax=Danionella cerebrum TaxID=2873325 RepID=A0A553NH25_9TELE|nr:hypothetical protein DNTS_022753 [Danionella translucida]
MEDTLSTENKDSSSLNREKPNPAPPSCVSLKSDWSMIEPITFNNKTTTDKMREIISSEPSCRSMMEFEERKR